MSYAIFLISILFKMI